MDTVIKGWRIVDEILDYRHVSQFGRTKVLSQNASLVLETMVEQDAAIMRNIMREAAFEMIFG